MSYTTIDITEVGPPEYPLIAVLRDTIAAEHHHVYRTSIEEMVRDRPDLICLIAHLEGNPVGYKVGYRDKPKVFYSYSGGVLKDYRGQGIARRLQALQHGMIKSRGYTSVYYNTFNKFRNMLLFGLDTGFVPMGVEFRAEGEVSIKLTKDLTQPDAPPRRKLPAASVHIETVAPNYHGLIADLASQTNQPATEAEIDQELTGPHPLPLVAFVDSKPVGFSIGCGHDAQGHLFESHLAGVLPEYQNQGVASALVRHQIDAVTAMRYRTLRVHAKHDNTPMIRLCLHQGFNLNGMICDDRRKRALVVLDRSLNSL
jgi:ribosomal protein S18 acetylase RimI-like enzyme